MRLLSVASVAGVAVVVATGDWAVAHDVVAHATHALLAAVALTAWAAHRRLFPVLPAVAFALAGVSALAGLPAGIHLALGGIAFATAAVSAALAFRAAGEPVAAGSWRDYITLTKPRIMSLLLLTGAGGMFVAAQGTPPLGAALVGLLGLALACGGASALNHVLDRDIDVHMQRTGRRPVASGRVAPARALEFGLALSALSYVLLVSFVNVPTALLALAGNLFYVLVYTRWLKRSTPQNIVIGGAAGAVPPLVGWAAVTGDLTLPALFLFLVVFVWTPPHFWALALLLKRDYEQARIPMLPVVKGDVETTRAILRYSLLLVAVTLLPFVWRTLGVVYLGAALALGVAFVALALALRRQPSPARARRLFSFSLAYLALLLFAGSIVVAVIYNAAS